MRVVLDACVLYPTVLRQILMESAKAGLFEPLWSERILEEWRRAVLRNHPEDGNHADGDIAQLRANWPQASIILSKDTPENMVLPDHDDVHVLQAAVEGHADELLTANIQDFPTRVLSSFGVVRRDPDGFLLEMAQSNPDQMHRIVALVVAQFQQMSGQDQEARALLKRARLPRLAKFTNPKD